MSRYIDIVDNIYNNRCFMLCCLKYDYNDFNTVSFIIIWCYDVIYCDVCLV